MKNSQAAVNFVSCSRSSLRGGGAGGRGDTGEGHNAQDFFGQFQSPAKSDPHPKGEEVTQIRCARVQSR